MTPLPLFGFACEPATPRIFFVHSPDAITQLALDHPPQDWRAVFGKPSKTADDAN